MTKQNTTTITHPNYDRITWAPDSMGSCPTAAQLNVAGAFKPRGHGLEALALAQALRRDGVTRSQMLSASAAYKAAYMPAVPAIGSPAYNQMVGKAGLVAAGYLNLTSRKPALTVNVAPRGLKYIELHAAQHAKAAASLAGDKPAKAQRKAKAP